MLGEAKESGLYTGSHIRSLYKDLKGRSTMSRFAVLWSTALQICWSKGRLEDRDHIMDDVA